MEMWWKRLIALLPALSVSHSVRRTVEAITAEPSPVLELGASLAAALVVGLAVMKGLDYLFPDKEQSSKNSPVPTEERRRAPSLEPELTPHVSQAVERSSERSPTHFREMVARREERQGGREL